MRLITAWVARALQRWMSRIGVYVLLTVHVVMRSAQHATCEVPGEHSPSGKRSGDTAQSGRTQAAGGKGHVICLYSPD
jgi:hypothetical protein